MNDLQKIDDQVRHDEEALAFVPTKDKPSFVIQDLLSPVLGSAVLLPYAVSFVGVVAAANPSLEKSFPTLLASLLFSQGMTSLVFWRCSQHCVCTNVDLLQAAYLAAMGRALTFAGVPSDVLLFHIFLAQGLMSLVIGILMWTVAELDGLYYMRFLPYPVSAGFVSGIGMMIFDGGLELGCGQGLLQLLGDLLTAAQSFEVTHAGIALLLRLCLTLVGAGIFLGLKELLDHYALGRAIRLPLGLAVISSVVYGFLYLHPLSLEELQFWGLFISELRPEPWVVEWELLGSGFGSFHARAFFSQPCISVLVSYAALSTLAFTFYTVGFQDMAKDPEIELAKEIRLLGKTNIALAPFAGVPVSHAIKVWVVMRDAGGKTRWWVLLFSVCYMALYFDSTLRSSLSFIPKCAFGALVVSLGFEFLTTSLVESRERIAATEWRVVVATSVITYLNVLLGILFGVVLTTVFFMVEYSGMTGVTQKATLSEVRSHVERDDEQNQIIDTYGRQVAVFWCAGYIFFGTAQDIVEELQASLDASPSTHILILDFEQVPAVDASGVQALVSFAEKGQRRRPAVTLAISGVVRRLQLSLDRCMRACQVEMKISSHRVEKMLEWAEEWLLSGREKGRLKSQRSEHQLLASKLAEKLKVPTTKEQDEKELLHFVSEFLLEIASTAKAEERAAVGEKLAKFGSKLKTYRNQERLYAEGQQAKDLTYVLSGSVSIVQRISPDEALAYKVPRHHLNEEKGDTFAFEEELDIRVRKLTHGSVLGALEFGAFCSGRAPTWHASACAAPDCMVLRVPFSTLESAMASSQSVGNSVMQWLFKLASIQVLDVLQGVRVKPYRRIDQEGVFKRAASPDPAVFAAFMEVQQELAEALAGWSLWEYEFVHWRYHKRHAGGDEFNQLYNAHRTPEYQHLACPAVPLAYRFWSNFPTCAPSRLRDLARFTDAYVSGMTVDNWRASYRDFLREDYNYNVSHFAGGDPTYRLSKVGEKGDRYGAKFGRPRMGCCLERFRLDERIPGIRHVVMFSFKAHVSAADEIELLKAINTLPQKIPEILQSTVGSDLRLPGGQSHPAGKNRSMVWLADFQTRAHFEAFESHSAHLDLMAKFEAAIDPDSFAAIQYAQPATVLPGFHHIVMLDLKEGTKHEDILKLQTSMLLGGMREKGEFVTYIPEKASTPKPSYQGYFP
eukprot:s2191_g3.t1